MDAETYEKLREALGSRTGNPSVWDQPAVSGLTREPPMPDRSRTGFSVNPTQRSIQMLAEENLITIRPALGRQRRLRRGERFWISTVQTSPTRFETEHLRYHAHLHSGHVIGERPLFEFGEWEGAAITFRPEQEGSLVVRALAKLFASDSENRVITKSGIWWVEIDAPLAKLVGQRVLAGF